MSKKEKRKIAVIDCETDPFEKGLIPQPFIWGFYDGEIYKQFDNENDVAEFLRDQEIIVYAHNGGKFDFHYLKKWANLYENIMIIAGRIAKFKIGKCELRDSFCILPVPLAQYKKTVFDYNKMKKKVRHKHMVEIQAYLKDDCVDLYNFIMEFSAIYGNHLTIASCAMKEWQKMSGKKEKTHAGFFKCFSDFYFGGRVECFKTGVVKGDIKVADITSAYPYAMIHDHPAGKKFNIGKTVPEKGGNFFIALNCIAKGCFPIREKEGLRFPNDNEKRLYLVTGWEYLAAKDLKLISQEKINCVYTFDETVNFTPYIDRFFELKKTAKETGNKAEYISSKLFLNSLYGKFAANPDNYKEYMVVEGGEIENYEEIGWQYANGFCTNHLIEKAIDDSRKHYYNVATAASITGFVRAYLLRNIHNVARPLYCDTDSITFIGNHSLLLGKELGQWELEFEADSAAIAGKKLYSIRSKHDHTKFKTASKGVRLKPEDIFKIAKGEEITYLSDVPTYSFKKGIFFQPRKIKKTN